jgi:hypothetical protein
MFNNLNIPIFSEIGLSKCPLSCAGSSSNKGSTSSSSSSNNKVFFTDRACWFVERAVCVKPSVTLVV